MKKDIQVDLELMLEELTALSLKYKIVLLAIAYPVQGESDGKYIYSVEDDRVKIEWE